MKLSKNKNALKYIILCVVITVISTIIMFITTIAQNKMYTKHLNEQIASILGEIQREYSDFDDEKIIKILNSDSEYKQGREMLKKYYYKCANHIF